jgi:hypothetical protein
LHDQREFFPRIAIEAGTQRVFSYNQFMSANPSILVCFDPDSNTRFIAILLTARFIEALSKRVLH